MCTWLYWQSSTAWASWWAIVLACTKGGLHCEISGAPANMAKLHSCCSNLLTPDSLLSFVHKIQLSCFHRSKVAVSFLYFWSFTACFKITFLIAKLLKSYAFIANKRLMMQKGAKGKLHDVIDQKRCNCYSNSYLAWRLSGDSYDFITLQL